MVKLFRFNVNLADVWVLSHDKLSDFYLSSWQRGESAVPMLVVRLVLSATAVAVVAWSLVDEFGPYWPVYLSQWALCLFAAMMLSALLVSFLAVRGKIQDDAEVPWFIGMYWLLYNQAVCFTIIVTALYWLNPQNRPTARAFYLDIFTHGVNVCIAVTELMGSRTPVRFLHFYQPLGFGLWYASFTGIYYAAGGISITGQPYLYKALDWRNARKAGTIVSLCMVSGVAVYTIVWALAQCRDFVSGWLVRTTSHDLPPTPPDHFTHSRKV